MSKSYPRQSFFWVSLALFWLGLSLGLTLQQVWNPSAEHQLYLILAGGLILVGRAFLGAARAEQRLHTGGEASLVQPLVPCMEAATVSAPLGAVGLQALSQLFAQQSLQQSALEHAAAAVERAQAEKEARSSPRSDCPTSIGLHQIRVRPGIRYELVPSASDRCPAVQPLHPAAASPETTGPLLSPGRRAPGGYHLK